MVPFVSSIFLRKLLLPGVHHNAALYATLAEYGRHLVESELRTLTADGLKKEILSVIEHEVIIVISIKSRISLLAFLHTLILGGASYGKLT